MPSRCRKFEIVLAEALIMERGRGVYCNVLIKFINCWVVALYRLCGCAGASNLFGELVWSTR